MAAVKRPADSLLFAAGIFILLVSLLNGCSSPVLTPIPLTTVPSPFSGQVYIGGEVNSPGIYPVRTDDTLNDLVRAAGGLKPGTDFSQVTLSFSPQGQVSVPQKIDINLAEAWLLQALPGIGPSLAAAIVEHRTLNGPFRSVEELTAVKGIGLSTLDRLRDLITVSLPEQTVWP